MLFEKGYLIYFKKYAFAAATAVYVFCIWVHSRHLYSYFFVYMGVVRVDRSSVCIRLNCVF